MRLTSFKSSPSKLYRSSKTPILLYSYLFLHFSCVLIVAHNMPQYFIKLVITTSYASILSLHVFFALVIVLFVVATISFLHYFYMVASLWYFLSLLVLICFIGVKGLQGTVSLLSQGRGKAACTPPSQTRLWDYSLYVGNYCYYCYYFVS